MPIPTQSQIGGEQQTAQAIADSVSTQMRVAMPGIIQSFDPDAVTCTVEVALRGIVGDGSTELKPLVDVPVIFPRGGGCTLTFPVKEGDECLLIFADRCIDFWWQSGGVQETVDPRQHDLSDAFAIVGPQSQARKISGISTSAAQLRTDDGAAFVEVAAGHNITIKTPGQLTATAEGGTTITSPTITLNGNVTINGNLSQGMGESGGTATMLGPVNGFITKMSAAFGKDFQALDATLTALAGLATGANKLPYFTGTDKAAQTDLTSVGRDIIGKNTIADILTYLGLGGVSSGMFPIGMPFYWPNAKMPNELLPEWAGMTFLKWNGSTFSAAKFPKLALVIPSLTLTETRGEFIRTLDDGRGVDAGRALLSAQSDAMQKITGSVSGVQFRGWGGTSTSSGSLSNELQSGITGNSSTGGDAVGNIKIDTSLQSDLRIASENRPRNIAFNFLVRAA